MCTYYAILKKLRYNEDYIWRLKEGSEIVKIVKPISSTEDCLFFFKLNLHAASYLVKRDRRRCPGLHANL